MGLTERGEWAPVIPSLARASSLGLFFFRKLLGGLLREGRGQESVRRVTPWGVGSAHHPGAHLDGSTGTGTGPGRLWYMRMMFRISLLGSAFLGGGSGLRTTAAPPRPASLAGSASASRAALAPPRVCGVFTNTGGGGDGTDQEDRKHMRPPCRTVEPDPPPTPQLPNTCTGFLFLLFLLLLLLLLGDLHLCRRLHHLYLDVLLPCK